MGKTDTIIMMPISFYFILFNTYSYNLYSNYYFLILLKNTRLKIFSIFLTYYLIRV